MPIGSTPWSLSRFKVWIEIYFVKKDITPAQVAQLILGGVNSSSLTVGTNQLISTLFEKVEFEVIQFASDFSLNEIPTASALIALGRNVEEVSQLSEIHKRLNDMKLLLPVKVWMQASSTVGEPNKENWPAEPFLLFDGYANGSGFRKTSHGADFTLFMIHWLSDLSFSSSVSGSVHPLSAAQLSFFSSVPFGNADAGGAGGKNMVAATVANQFINKLIIQKDFWAAAEVPVPGRPPGLGQTTGGLKTFFKQLCATDIMSFLPVRPAGLTERVKPNTEALRALERFEPFGATYKWGVPLSMNPGDDAVNEIAQAIAMHVSFLTFDNLVGYTIWDKLLELTSEYQMAVVPMIDRALVVPFQPGLRGGARRSILTDEYDQKEETNQMPRPIRGVCVYLGMPGAQAGAEIAGDRRPGDSFNGACWDPSEKDPTLAKGTVMFKEAPPWLSSIVPIFNYPKPIDVFTSGIVPVLDGGSGLTAKVIQEYTKAGRPADIIQKINPTLLRFAKSTYSYEILRGRQGVVGGKLRFDIGPGSTVKVEGSEDPFLRGQNTAFDEHTYASVIRVVTAINAETGGAGTTFHLAFLRNEVENKSDRTSVGENVLWNTKESLWYGCPLIDNPTFD